MYEISLPHTLKDDAYLKILSPGFISGKSVSSWHKSESGICILLRNAYIILTCNSLSTIVFCRTSLEIFLANILINYTNIISRCMYVKLNAKYNVKNVFVSYKECLHLILY